MTLEVGGGGLDEVTVTVTELGVPVMLPSLAVAVYVVVTEGFTVKGLVGELFNATEPIPLSIVTDVALVDVHVSVADPLAAMDVGLADN